MTRPERFEVSVTGTIGEKSRLKAPMHTATAATMAATIRVANHSDEMHGEPAVLCRLKITLLSREVEIAGLAVEGQGDEQNDETRCDQ